MVDIKQQRVVIIGHGSTSRLGIVRAVAELGCQITVVVMTWNHGRKLDTRKPFDCYSKYISDIHYCHAKDGDGLIDLLLNKCIDPNQKVILLPDSDFSAATIDANRDRLSSHFVFPSLVSGSMLEWMNKQAQQSVAREVGLNVVSSSVIKITQGQFDVPNGICYPCFTKALITVSGGKQLFCRCNNVDELRTQLEKIAQKQDTEVLVEDFKTIEDEYAVLGFSDGKNVVIPGIIKFVSNTVSHFGIARTGLVMPVSGFETLLDTFKEFVRRVGFRGVFDIDFYYSGGAFYFGEMNLRFGGSGYSYTKMGVNLPAMLIHYLRGEEYLTMNGMIEASASYVNERMCEDDWYRGFISAKEYRRILNSADISFVRDEKDPCPYRIFKLSHYARSLKLLMNRKRIWC